MIKSLGKGLASLIGEADLNLIKTDHKSGEKIVVLNIADIDANPDQPRKTFDDKSLDGLAQSIKNKGVISPIIVVQLGNKYQIVAGERRYRASKIAGFTQVPAIIKKLEQKEIFEIALIENIQREDLNPVEEAEAYKQLIENYNYTHNEIADIVGKSRSHVTNILRILTLSNEILRLVEEGKLSAGHARTLIGKENAIDLARRIVKEHLNVRQAEVITKAKALEAKITAISEKVMSAELQEAKQDIKLIEQLLAQRLKTKVEIRQGASIEKGSLKLEYKSLEELDKFLQLLTKQ